MQCDMTGSLSLVLRLCSVCPQAPFCPQPQPLPADSWLAFCNNGRTWHLTILAKYLSKVDSSISDWECCPPSLSRALLYRQRPSVESLPGSSQGHCQLAEPRASAVSEGSHHDIIPWAMLVPSSSYRIRARGHVYSLPARGTSQGPNCGQEFRMKRGNMPSFPIS